MNKAHVTLFALLVAAATVLGAVALTRTTNLGRAARHTNDAAVVAQTKQLSAYAAKLKKELKAKPPALPPVPKGSSAGSQSATPHVVYQQPPPIVTVIHRHHGDDGPEGGGGRND
jgi:non-ribosomal peptide synthetase component E (peptide arylation enzyme)